MVVADEFPDVGRPMIFVDDPRDAFAKIVMFFRPPVEVPVVGLSPHARIDPTAQLDESVRVHPGAVIGAHVRIGRGCEIHSHVTIMPGCEIGADVVLFPNVVVYEGSQVGDRCVIHAGAVIGAYGFGYDTVQGRHQRGPQLGYVLIESDVEIGACTTVDRGTYGPTVIGEGTKIDNQVMIAHNCRIGRHNLICSQVGVAGSSSSGDYVVMAGQVGVPDHVRIGHRAVLGAKAGIMRDVPDDTTVLGIPATPERDQMAKQAAFAKLPEMRKQLRKLQRAVDELTQSLSPSATRKSPEAA
jgi:UDP-3-O-[3-hydroxymyristoyl] glucosamine N-acyltransferase